MCPECFPHLAVVIAGLTSTSGMTALVANFATPMNRAARARAATLGPSGTLQAETTCLKTRLETPRIETCRLAATWQRITRSLSILGLVNRHTGIEQVQDLSHPEPGP